jgi:hypothetical protein
LQNKNDVILLEKNEPDYSVCVERNQCYCEADWLALKTEADALQKGVNKMI